MGLGRCNPKRPPQTPAFGGGLGEGVSGSPLGGSEFKTGPIIGPQRTNRPRPPFRHHPLRSCRPSEAGAIGEPVDAPALRRSMTEPPEARGTEGGEPQRLGQIRLGSRGPREWEGRWGGVRGQTSATSDHSCAFATLTGCTKTLPTSCKTHSIARLFSKPSL